MSVNECWQIVQIIGCTAAGRGVFWAKAALNSVGDGSCSMCGLETGVDGHERGSGSSAASCRSISSSSSCSTGRFAATPLRSRSSLSGVSIWLAAFASDSLASSSSWTVAGRLLRVALRLSLLAWHSARGCGVRRRKTSSGRCSQRRV